ncbi:MAG TPA: LysM peptidoglycan-binding domain-containing protein [Thermoanaerobaculia bacterium]|jgi:nucleoid-associated protein YgaU|nr:LysM peptidoglycan-binding domain-containing protein [Thermoanaerobaculia bacterium]
MFGKSDDKEKADIARNEEARRKMEEALARRQQQQATPAAAAPPPAADQVRPAAAPAAQQSAADFETYTVAKGDSLSKIAKHHLGNANDWNRIYEANRAVIGDNPDKIFPGQQLKIPRRANPTA